MIWEISPVRLNVAAFVVGMRARGCLRAATAVLALVPVLALILGTALPVRAVDVAGAPPCSENALRAALEQLAPAGGSLAVACETDFAVNSPITVADDISLTLSGSIQLTSSGNRFFVVEPGAALTLRDLTLTGADVSGDGGAISSAGRLTLDNVRLIDNSATQGGAVAATGTVRIDDSHFVGNQAARGGAISIGAGATLTATTSTFVQNAASVEGGALYLAGSATLTDTTWSANDAPNAGAIRVLPKARAQMDECLMRDGSSNSAPALHNSGETDLNRCIITNMNTTADYGAVDNDGLLRITNTIFLDNKSVDANSLHNHTVTTLNLSRVELTFVTFLGRAGNGLGEVINNGNLTMRNSVINSVARYTCYQGDGVADPMPAFVSLGGNVLSDDNVNAALGCFFKNEASTDHFKGAPLNVVEDTMGTLLVFPTADSPAIDGAACIATVTVDLRGVQRKQGNGCDSGAVETRPAETFFRMYLPTVTRR